jgi:hypothetical protein
MTAFAKAVKAGKKSKKRCRKSSSQCAAAVTTYCSPQADPLECQSLYLPCCKRFSGCNVAPAITCIYETFLSPL